MNQIFPKKSRSGPASFRCSSAGCRSFAFRGTGIISRLVSTVAVMLTLIFASHAQSTTFSFTGGVQTYSVTSTGTLAVDIAGAKGGDFFSYGGYPNAGGLGGRVVCSLAVTAGQVLIIKVGGQGRTSVTPSNALGGYNGGGTAYYCSCLGPTCVGGGGGGSSEIMIGEISLSNRVIVAGGGGGASGPSGYSANEQRGGHGGGLTGGGGNSLFGETSTGGTQSSGGDGSTPGTSHFGGYGSDPFYSGSGGGGGGYYGGSGGKSANYGGGGGSSYTHSTLVTSVTHTQGYQSGNGYVIISTVGGPALSASLSAQTNVACNGASTGSATVSASGGAGGYTYGWSPSGGSSAVASGLAAGSYTCTVTDAASATTTVTVNITQPSAPLTVGSISGAGSYCVGYAINFSASGSGGTGGYSYSWSGPSSYSAAGASPSIGSASSANSGTYTVTVTDANTCSVTATAAVTVGSTPSASTGPSSTCVGGSITLSNVTGGGTWSSSNTSIATVGLTTGVVAGVDSGTVNITYTPSSGCYTVKNVSIQAMSPITGTPYVCLNTTSDLDNALPGGTWSVATPYYATVDATTGVITGVHSGATTVTYSAGSGCSVTATVYTSNVILNIAGGLSVCEGSTSALSTPGYPGGTWSTPDSVTAFINATTGALLGISAGTVPVTVTYGYCYASAVATVNPVPASISGGGAVCAGSTLALSCSTGGGVWSSSNTAKATVNSSGVVTGVAPGTATIYYTIGTGCRATKLVTVGGMPASIGGTATLCAGSTTTLSCTTLGGTWSSGSTGIADVASTTATATTSYAVVNGVSAGGAVVSYSHPGGCVQTVNVTVAAPPSAIGGTLAFCVGGSSPLTGGGGGTWSSGNTTVASIGMSTGVATGVASGTAGITYRTSATCYTASIATVSVAPAISGAASVCKGFTTTFTHGTGGGTWSSSNAAVASVNASGIVTGVNAGLASITYHIATGCYAIKSVYVYNNPAAITGTAAVCRGGNTTLSAGAGTTATWSCGDTTVATVGATSGVVTGVSTGNVEITFTATATGCYSTRVVTVNESPSAITGATTICVDANETYLSTPSGGTWSSTVPAVGSINPSTGIATGRTGGGTIIKYTLTGGCSAAKSLVVAALPAAITGNTPVCVGNTIVLTSATSGSTWSTTAPGTAAIASSTATTATISGVASGVANISYTNAAGCARVAMVTVNAALAPIAGDSVVCSGGVITLTNATGGGTWSSNITSRVSVATATGIATGGATTGVATITYKVGAGCTTTKAVTNNAALPNIGGGATTTCSGTSGAVTFTNSVSGGTWSTSNASVAVIDAASGLLTGVLMGGSNTYVNVVYTTGAGCSKTKSILIKPQPVVTGADEVAVGSTTALTASPAGGAWVSGTAGIATVSGYGVVTGVATGSAVISYTAAGCVNTKYLSVTGSGSSRPAGMTEEAVVLFSVFPNPTHGALSVSTGVAGTFAIYTVDGKLASTSELTEGVNAISMPVGMAAGTYLCRFHGVDGSVQAVRLVYQP